MDERVILEKFKEFDRKLNVIANEHGEVGPGVNGLVPNSECNAMITGVLGGKGFVSDGTNLDNVTHGGVYFLNPDYNYKNVPFLPIGTSNYRMQLTVISNFGVNPLTTNPLIYQRVETIELSGAVKTAYRFYFGKWLTWYYPEGVTLWSGSQAADGSTLGLTESLTNYQRIKIYWQAFNRGIVTSEIPTSANEFSVSTVNVPNTTSDNQALSMIEILFKQANNGANMTVNGRLYYIQNDVNESDSDAKQSRIIKIIGYK